MKILVTGCAGFIGFHTSLSLLKRGYDIAGIDNLNDYYDISLKNDRLKILLAHKHFNFQNLDIFNYDDLLLFFKKFSPENVIHLAAQAGVRFSVLNPRAYVDTNLTGFLNILECSRYSNINHLIYASSSSVYGLNAKLPFSEIDGVDHPVSVYAATKKANELLAHSYSHLFHIPTTGLRFFTVYGPWGRPDMSPFIFSNSILSGRPIDIYNNGEMMRDFTFIDDVVECIIRLLDKPATASSEFTNMNPNPSISSAPYRIFNVGNSKSIKISYYINVLENALGVKAVKNYLPLQLGDVINTSSDAFALKDWIGFSPSTEITEGISEFVLWYKNYYKVS